MRGPLEAVRLLPVVEATHHRRRGRVPLLSAGRLPELFSVETATPLQGPLNPLQDPAQLQPALRIVLGNNEALVCTYAILIIAVGFSAERFLSPIMDRVMNKLFITAEKTESSPGPPLRYTPPEDTGPQRPPAAFPGRARP